MLFIVIFFLWMSFLSSLLYDIRAGKLILFIFPDTNKTESYYCLNFWFIIFKNVWRPVPKTKKMIFKNLLKCCILKSCSVKINKCTCCMGNYTQFDFQTTNAFFKTFTRDNLRLFLFYFMSGGRSIIAIGLAHVSHSRSPTRVAKVASVSAAWEFPSRFSIFHQLSDFHVTFGLTKFSHPEPLPFYLELVLILARSFRVFSAAT